MLSSLGLGLFAPDTGAIGIPSTAPPQTPGGDGDAERVGGAGRCGSLVYLVKEGGVWLLTTCRVSLARAAAGAAIVGRGINSRGNGKSSWSCGGSGGSGGCSGMCHPGREEPANR